MTYAFRLAAMVLALVPFTAQAGLGGKPPAGVAQAETSGLPVLSTIPTGALVVGGLVIVGGIVIGVVAATDDDDETTTTTTTTSDRRLKTEISRLDATTPSGHPLYTFRYVWDEPGTFRMGVMAQDLPKELQVTLPGGWLGVDYKTLGY